MVNIHSYMSGINASASGSNSYHYFIHICVCIIKWNMYSKFTTDLFAILFYRANFILLKGDTREI